ncbi:MAG: hypothetical protein Q8880_01470 [Bacteroidota bacterium]|nr:hypothetical protein [Bacteroidota bacterium]
MKRSLFLIILLFTVVLGFSQTTKSSSSNTNINYDYFIIGGFVGAGGVVSTNIVNSGALFPAGLDFMLQDGHLRYGLGLSSELYLTPENLAKVIFSSNTSNVTKVYFEVEPMLFKWFIINLGVNMKLGGFWVGKGGDDMNPNETHYFGNVGALVELGPKKFMLFVNPYLEYKSYGSWHKELIGAVELGLKIRIPSDKMK